MKKIIASLAVVAAFSCTNAQKTTFSAQALSEKLLSIEGNKLEFQEILNQNKGKVLLIEVWASWCGDCVKAMPKLKELQRNNPEVTYIFISMDKTVEKWKEGVAKHELQGEQFFDHEGMKGAFAKEIDLDWIPRYIVIDKTLKIAIYRAVETDFDKINNTLNQLINEK